MTSHSDSDWKVNYQRAKRYCNKLLYDSVAFDKTMTSADLVHDTYLKWHEAKNENVFNHPQGKIARIIKNVNSNRLSRSKWYWNGKVNYRTSSEDVATRSDFSHFEDARNSVLHSWGFRFPTQEFEQQDIINHLIARLSPMEKQILELKTAGYQNQEIEKIVKRTNPVISRAIKRIKKHMTHLKLNPFNGSKVTVVKKISRKTYESNPEQYLEFEKGDQFMDNEYYTLLTSKNNPMEGLLIKENTKD